MSSCRWLTISNTPPCSPHPWLACLIPRIPQAMRELRTWIIRVCHLLWKTIEIQLKNHQEETKSNTYVFQPSIPVANFQHVDIQNVGGKNNSKRHPCDHA
jgi:hypothetical protein